jgi:hypothetical protein
VSQRFSELQGLSVAASGLVFTVVFGAYLIAKPAPGRGGIWIALAIALVLIVPITHLSRRYYTATLGRVSPKKYRMAVVQLGAIAVAMGVIDRALSVSAPATRFHAPQARSGSRSGITVRATTSVLRAAAGAFALQIVPMANIGSDAALAAGFGLVGLVYVPIGFLDHRLLVSSIRAQAEAVRLDSRRGR